MNDVRPMDCRHAVARLWDLLDGDIDAIDRAALERHLAFCVRCCGELAFAEELRSLLRRRTEAVMPADVEERLARFVDALPDPLDHGEVSVP